MDREEEERRSHHIPNRAASSVTAAGRSTGRGAAASPPSSAAIGGLVLGTWTCRECPFAFPNPAERDTCESCGARKGAAGGVHDNRRRQAVTRVNATSSAGSKGRTVEGAAVPWACSACTVLNTETFLVCGTCETPRQRLVGSGSGSSFPTPVAAQADGGSGTVMATANQNDRWNRNDDSGFVFAGTPSEGSSSSNAGHTCAVCTLRNTAQEVVCSACGIPLLESAAAAAATGGREERVGAAAAGRLGGREELESRGEAVSCANGTEIIDLS